MRVEPVLAELDSAFSFKKLEDGYMGFKVYDFEGNDVTDSRQWFVDPLGCLYIFADGVLHSAKDDYWYSPE